MPALAADGAFSHGGLRPDGTDSRFSPIFRYPLDDALRALESSPEAADGSQRIRYVNPINGGSVMPLLDCWMFRVKAGHRTLPFRTSAHSVCAVVGGRGSTRVGTSSIDWSDSDVFTLPHGMWIEHCAEEASLIFVASDRELYRRLDLLTEEYQSK